MSTDNFQETDRAKIREVLARHLPAQSLSEDEIEALVKELAAARPSVVDLVTEEDIAARMYWSIPSSRTYRAKNKELFPEPFARRVFWLRSDIENYFKEHWHPTRTKRSSR